MKNKHSVPVPRTDVSLFAKMAQEYVSQQEKEFFERLCLDEASVPTICGQIYIHEEDNADRIFFIRRNSHEYELDNASVPQGVEAGGYYDSLAEVMNVYLDDIHIHGKHITLLEWLRMLSYDCVRYDRNLDKIGG